MDTSGVGFKEIVGCQMVSCAVKERNKKIKKKKMLYLHSFYNSCFCCRQTKMPANDCVTVAAMKVLKLHQ